MTYQIEAISMTLNYLQGHSYCNGIGYNYAPGCGESLWLGLSYSNCG